MPRVYQRAPIDVRFWAKVDRGLPDECWPWIGAKTPRGYGVLWGNEDGNALRAHRLSYQLNVGVITDGLFVCHRCDNPPCVNPAHLYLGTHDDNMADKIARGRCASGERSGGAKFTDEQVREVRLIHARGGITRSALAKRFGISPSQMTNILNNRQRRSA